MSTSKKHLLFCSIFIFVFNFTFGQNQRPRIGLVLSGGGAKGVAHIGVLKAMEEAGLTPDYITGTSMGSIVGGLYAIGYSADELKAIVEGIDWDLYLTNKIPFDKVTFEEKFYYGRYLLDFFIENKKLRFPQGVIEGQALTAFFSNITRPVHGVENFSDFPIPFACVGTDITTGKPVVLNKGSLATAMRASMAIPSVFTPVKIDGKLLVDGGLVRNMPVPEVIDMGADIVIGVFVSSDLLKEEELNSAFSILSQSAFITSAFDSREQLAKCDILIEPDLEGFSTGSFQETPAIMERGAEAGKAYFEVFKNLADSLKKLGPLHEAVKPEIEEYYIFDRIEVEGNDILQEEFVLGKMRIEPGEPVTIDHIERRIEVIYGTQYFEQISYEILGEKDRHLLRLQVEERPKTQLRFAYHYDSENKGGVVGNITLRNLLLNRSRLIFEADLATQPSLLMDYFKYLGEKQNTAFGASATWHRNELPVYDSIGNIITLFASNFTAGSFKFQATRVQSSTFGVEAQWSRMNLKPRIADEELRQISKIQYNNTSLTFFHYFDNFNSRYFPTRGLRSQLEVSATPRVGGEVVILDTLTIDARELGDLLQTSDIFSLNFSVYPILPITGKLSLLAKARLRLSSIKNNSLNLDEFDFIGGFTPDLINANEYWGVGTKEFGLANYFYGRVGFQYEVFRNVFLQAQINYLDSEGPVTWLYPDADTGRLGDRNRRYGYGGLIGLQSPIGPIAFAFAKDHYRPNWQTSLIIGFYY